MSDEKRRPVASKKFDRVDVAIWRNEWEDGSCTYEATFSRSHKKEDGEWKRLYSFHKRDVPHLQRGVAWSADQLDMLSEQDRDPEDQ